MSGFGTGSNSYGQFWFGGNAFPGFLFKKNVGVAGRRSTKFNPGGNIICNSPTYLYNKYKPGGGGVGASSIANRRAKNRLATVCNSQQCFPCFNTLGQYSNYTHNPNGFIPCPAITTTSTSSSVTPTPPPPPTPSGSEYTVTYNNNGGTGSIIDANSPYVGGDSVTILGLGTVAKSGYQFGGWNTAADGTGLNYVGDDTFIIDANTTLYANWIIGGVRLVYNAGTGGTGTAPSSSGTYYTAFSEADVVENTGSFTNSSGYTFGGWNTAANGSGTSYPAGSEYTMPGSGTVTLYAQWINPAITYSLTYNAGTGGTGTAPASPTSYDSNSPANILGNTGSYTNSDPTKIFYGWNTLANGTGTSYPVGSTITMNANKTLYAQWGSLPLLTVTYNANGATGGSVPAEPTNYPTNVQVPILGQGSLTRPGYTFLGWNGSPTGTGSLYAPGYTFTSKTATLYAHWAPGSPVKACSGGTLSSSYISYTFPYAMTIASSNTVTIYTTALASAVPTTATSYGSGTAPEGLISILSKVVITSSTIQINTNTTYAVTTENNYSQTINNDGSGFIYWPAGQTLTNVTLPTIQPRTSNPPNYYGQTRNVTNGCGLTAFDNSSGGNVCNFGFFTQGVTLNYSGGASTQIVSCPTNSVYRNSGGSFVTAPKSLYPYPVVSYSGGPAIVPRSSAALTAITIIPSTGSEYVYPAMPNYTVQFDGNGANQISATAAPNNTTSGGSPRTPTYFAPYTGATPTNVSVLGNTGALTKTDTTTLNEFVFTKWNTAADGTGTSYGPGFNAVYYSTSFTNILYAQWTPGYYVRYSNNLPLTTPNTGGSVTDASSPYLPTNPLVTVKANGFLWTGHTFIKWNTQANGGGMDYYPTNQFTLNANTMLYAQWS